ncbi:sigma-70 family RNA polymerase sigma factor [Tersicoccus sp. MR15.9]|uniref:sigma-70 family RNA polymerase sigma factor n=1 Tax=Tersicoccus mangrovi TaxID=3121635 RepID=UPI002FE5EC67
MPTADDDASDGQLVGAVRAGDRRAFGILYERHRDAAWRVARRYANSAAQADDLVAEAFANMLAAIRRGAGPRDNVRAYLVTIVAHEAARAARSTRGQYSTEAIELAEVPQVFDDPVLKSFDAETIRRAFLTLPERSRAVLWYAAVEGLKPAAIGPLIGLSPNATSVALRRAREQLSQAYLQCHVRAVGDHQCAAVGPSLAAYAAGRLRGPALASTRAHVESCLTCSAAVLHLRDVKRGLRAAYLPLAAAPSTGPGLLAALGIGTAVAPTARAGRWGLAAFAPGGAGTAAVTATVVVVGVAVGIGAGRLVTAEPAPAATLAAAAPGPAGGSAGGLLGGSGLLPGGAGVVAGAASGPPVPGVRVSGQAWPSSGGGAGYGGGGAGEYGAGGDGYGSGFTGDVSRPGAGVWAPDGSGAGQGAGLPGEQPQAGVVPGFPGSSGDGAGNGAAGPADPGVIPPVGPVGPVGPVAPSLVPSSPTPGPSTPQATSSVPSTSVPPTSAPPTSAPPTSVPPTSAPPTSVPPTTAPPTSVPPTSVPPTSVPPTSVPPTSVPPTTVPPTSAPPTTAPPTTAPPTSAPPTSPSPTGSPTTTPTAPTLGVTPVEVDGRFWAPGPIDGVASARVTVTAPVADTDRRLTLQFRSQAGWLVIRRPASPSSTSTDGATTTLSPAPTSSASTVTVSPEPTVTASAGAGASADANGDRLTAEQARSLLEADTGATPPTLMTTMTVDMPAGRSAVTVDLVALRVSAVPEPRTVPAIPWVLTDPRDGATARGTLPAQPSSTASAHPTSTASASSEPPFTVTVAPTITASLLGER